MITGNENAFPVVSPFNRDELGLTIRQEFAARAMQALYSNNLMVDQFGCEGEIAEQAVKIADALIVELNK